MDDAVELTPLAIYHSSVVNPYEAARQPRADDGRVGEVRFLDDVDAETYEGLKHCERVWLLFRFHENHHWKPMVLPPRGTDQKVGVFATRAPYRPNPIGLSCVKVVALEKNVLRVEGADLLDGTPIFDVKPYNAETDAQTNARTGWLENADAQKYTLAWTPEAQTKLNALAERGVLQLEHFVRQQLEFAPFDGRRKRVTHIEHHYILAYRTWRIFFRETRPRELEVFDIGSGYTDADLAEAADKWNDKTLHSEFLKLFPRG